MFVPVLLLSVTADNGHLGGGVSPSAVGMDDNPVRRFFLTWSSCFHRGLIMGTKVTIISHSSK